MARLIDADNVLRKAQDPTYQVCGTRKVSERAVIWAMALVGSEPPVDAVEVVRCKDCRFKTEPGQPNILCYHMKDDDFCSYGERKTEK